MILVDNRNSTNPYLNLALEEFLIRQADCTERDLLLLYINEPCIVLGKNQSIYKEVNFDYLRNNTLKLCRRISGGGTVYQDLGNLSFCFITRFTDKKINNYEWFNRPVIAALKAIGVEAEMDARNSILCKGKKISGNAQFTNRKNIISHGTLLFNADLNTLRACLKPNAFKVESKAVESVSNSVRNMDAETTAVKTTEELKTYLQNALQTTEVMQLSDDDWEVIQKSADEKFRSFEWIYGRSPLTKIDKGDIQLEIEDGKIRSITGNETETLQLQGARYQYDDIKKALENHPNASAMLQAIF
ncbi:MAG: lipoate--protein ligase [Chitinophagales bacterium]|nr:lipoate--protein ligase [Chitinophagales bacterium]